MVSTKEAFPSFEGIRPSQLLAGGEPKPGSLRTGSSRAFVLWPAPSLPSPTPTSLAPSSPFAFLLSALVCPFSKTTVFRCICGSLLDNP